EKALDKVLTLNGVTYSWRVKEFPDKNFDSDKHVGVLAQEVEAVLPEAVETGEDGYKSVNYSNITPLLIEAVKELKAEKDALEATVANQQKENEAMKKEMAEMKKMLEDLMKK
ncbi:MAG: tail fiber domain-containing protein, partial [Salinivirgaceae bacterium]|nr:tail fiber domain-containing protein [Salinivirgaceae bacterium]